MWEDVQSISMVKGPAGTWRYQVMAEAGGLLLANENLPGAEDCFVELVGHLAGEPTQSFPEKRGPGTKSPPRKRSHRRPGKP